MICWLHCLLASGHMMLAPPQAHCHPPTAPSEVDLTASAVRKLMDRPIRPRAISPPLPDAMGCGGRICIPEGSELSSVWLRLQSYLACLVPAGHFACGVRRVLPLRGAARQARATTAALHLHQPFTLVGLWQSVPTPVLLAELQPSSMPDIWLLPAVWYRTVWQSSGLHQPIAPAPRLCTSDRHFRPIRQPNISRLIGTFVGHACFLLGQLHVSCGVCGCFVVNLAIHVIASALCIIATSAACRG